MYGGFKTFIPDEIASKWEIHQWHHGIPLVATVHPEEWADVLAVLGGFKLTKNMLVARGKNKSLVSIAIDSALYARGWAEKQFETAFLVDDNRYDSPTHSVDCFKNRVALEIEWNNKDPFFDRDLNNFRLLHQLRIIDVGIIVTRCEDLRKFAADLGRASVLSEASTHMSKLLPKIEGGGAGGCPVVVFGISARSFDPSS